MILSTVIEKGLSRAEVRAALEDFLREVDDVAYRRSARADGEPYRAIFLPPASWIWWWKMCFWLPVM